MSALMVSRLSSSSRQCCAAFSRKSLKTDGQVCRKIVHFKRIFKMENCYPINSEQLALATRFLSGYKPSTEDDHLKCWNCQEDFSHCVHSMITCSTCNAMRYPPPATKVDYFDLFDLPRSYEMDVKLLSQKFKSLQRLFHPDLFANRAEKEKALSETWSSLINEGYKTLLKPHLRANYLLELYGKPLLEGEMSLDPEFLAEIMELNEEISEVKTRSDVVELMSQVKELISDHEILTSKAFQSKDIDEARLVVAKMQYFVNIKDQLVKKETDMGIIH